MAVLDGASSVERRAWSVERRACSEQRAAGEDASGRNERMRRGRAAFYRGRKGRSKDRPRAADPLVLSSACPARSADRCDPPRPQPISALGGAPRQGPDGSKLARRARGWLSPHCAPQRCHPGARPGPGLEHGCDVHGGPQLACGCLGRRRNGELSGGWTGLGPSLVLYEKCAVCGQAHRVAQRLPFCEYVARWQLSPDRAEAQLEWTSQKAPTRGYTC